MRPQGGPASGGSGAFDVVQQSEPYTCGGPLQNACMWTARSDVPWIVVTPDVMLKGNAEYACNMPLNCNPLLIRSQIVVAGPIGEWTAPLITRRCRWSSSERPQSFERSNGSIGELKKNSPTLFIDFDSVYDTR